jgi:hypothetical protein
MRLVEISREVLPIMISSSSERETHTIGRADNAVKRRIESKLQYPANRCGAL